MSSLLAMSSNYAHSTGPGVDGGRNGVDSIVEVGKYPIYLQGFIDPRWLALGFLNHQQVVCHI